MHALYVALKLNFAFEDLCIFEHSLGDIFVIKRDWKCWLTLAGVAQWTECRHVNQRVAGSIPSQGTNLGCGPGQVPSSGAREKQTHIDVSLPLFLPPFHSV